MRLLSFSCQVYCSKFQVSIITGSGVMNIFVHQKLSRNMEIGNTSVWVFSNTWRLGRVRAIKLDIDVSNKILMNTAKYQSFSFYRFLVIKGKPTGMEGIKSPHTNIRVNFEALRRNTFLKIALKRRRRAIRKNINMKF